MNRFRWPLTLSKSIRMVDTHSRSVFLSAAGVCPLLPSHRRPAYSACILMSRHSVLDQLSVISGSKGSSKPKIRKSSIGKTSKNNPHLALHGSFLGRKKIKN